MPEEMDWVERRKWRMRVNISRCSSGVEHFLGKEEVVSSILINGSNEFLEIRVFWIGRYALFGLAKILKHNLKTDKNVKRDLQEGQTSR
jgi:hypothetical protein